MKECENRALYLFGELAAVAEKGGYSYEETTLALSKLLEYYRENGQLFLSGANIMGIAQYRQRQYEKKVAALGENAAAEAPHN